MIPEDKAIQTPGYFHISEYIIMKFRRLLYIVSALIIGLSLPYISPDLLASAANSSAMASASASAKKKSSKNKTSSKNRKKSSASSSKKSSGKKSRTSKKRTKTSSKSRTRKTTRAANPAPPKEQPSNDSLTLSVNKAVIENIPKDLNPGGLRVNRVSPNKRYGTLGVSLNENFTYMPVTRDLINDITKTVKHALPDSLADYNITLNVGTRNLSYYINKIDKLPEKYRGNVPFVTELKPFVHPKKGLEGDIIALWHSHGRYYRKGAWQWQRTLLFQSLEDTYTMGYVLPFLVPMLENAGAYVLLPRERDMSVHEVIVDNDTNEGGMLFSQTTYFEQNGVKGWQTGEGEGFIYDLPDFRDTENPFENGTYRQVGTIRSGKPSVAAWCADIPEDGEYAVYVSYKTLPNSTTDAHYTVNYSGGSKEFTVNQTMGGGTWIYLGTFPLKEGYSASTPVVTLSNLTEKGGDTVVTADAIKIGGGMGNIARSPNRSDIYYDLSTPESATAKSNINSSESSTQTSTANVGENEDEDVDDDSVDDDESVDDEGDAGNEDESDEDGEDEDAEEEEEQAPVIKPSAPVRKPVFSTSGMPRFLEGARYWMHWAGFPESVYSPFHGTDDYKDDYTSRGHWVNYLAGGSRVLPNKPGLNIPVDISFALHSDAGKRSDDSTVGTLGIYYTNNGASYIDGTPRSNSRILTDMLMRQITTDIRRTYEPNWTRRSMWDKSYLEARVAEVPTTLIEILSHQNFRDMQYGLDPNFRFVVSRAIYKGMARFIAERKNREVVIQPLPVHNFAITPLKKGHYRLAWEATPDSLEKTAMPHKYIILERAEGNLGFNKVGETSSTHFDVKVADDLIHSFKVIAANEGGLSFPSEILSLRATPSGKDILIVNGFSRISAPAHFSDNDGRAGFKADEDFGVPYLRDASFTGYQTEFRRGAGEGFGRSASNYIDKLIAGNTFDFPSVHGEAIADAGYGFVSVSAGAVESGKVKLADYPVVDLILGRQKHTSVGRGTSGVRYAAFPKTLQNALMNYVGHGGDLIVTGEYVASDLFDQYSGVEDRSFAENLLGVRPDGEASPARGRLNTHGSELGEGTYSYSNDLNKEQYIVQRPDNLEATQEGGRIIATFPDTGKAAGIHTPFGKGSVTVMSVPFESIRDEEQREALMKGLLRLAND